MRKLIAAALAVVLMVMVAAPAAQAGDATAQMALGLAAFAVFSQFVMPLLAGEPAYAPAPPTPVYLPPPPPPVVQQEYWYGPQSGYTPHPGYRQYGYAPQGPAGHFGDQGRYERRQWAWAHRGRLAPPPALQPQ